MLRRRLLFVAALVVAMAATSLAPLGAVSVSPEHGVTDPVVTPADGGQRGVVSASDGNGHLVVWEDERAEGTSTDIYGARVSADGQLLDPTGIPIAVGPNSQSSPSVAWDGTNYVVVWDDDREQIYSTDVYAARVTPGGRVLDREPIRVADDPESFESTPSVASSAAGTLVVWHGQFEADRDGGIQAAMVASDGTVGQPITLVARVANQRAPDVAASAAGFLVTWVDDLVRDGDQSDIFAGRISAAGEPLDPGGIPISTAVQPEDAATVASDGTDYLVSWTTRAAETFDADVMVAHLAAAGGTITRPDTPLADTASDETGSALSWNGQHYLATWVRVDPDSSGVAVRARRLAQDGSAVDLQPLALSRFAPGGFETAVVWNGAQWLVGLSVRNDAFVRQVGADGIAEERLLVSRAAGAQLSPAGAGGAQGALAVWQAWNGADYDVHATRLAADGTPLDPQGIVIAAAAGDQTEPDVAWNGRNYLVVWTDTRAGRGRYDIYGSRVAPGGAVRPAVRLSPLAGLQYVPAVAWGGSSYLVAWEEVRDAPADVGGALVQAGEAVGRLKISTARYDQGAPDVASDGRGFLVAFEDSRTEDFEVAVARVDAGGDVLDPRGVALTSLPRSQFLPSVAWNGRDYVVGWSDHRSADGSYDVYAARVTRDATVIDPDGTAVARGPDWLQNPVVVSRGRGVFVAWQQVGATGDLVGRKVARSGERRPPVVLSRQPSNEAHPALSAMGERTVLMYQRFVSRPAVRAIRVFARSF